jgi:hypothetical protein
MTAGCLFCLAGPAVASAQDGVTIDPGSPAGKEYAIPLEAARRGAAAEPPGGATGGAPPAFGVGVRSSPRPRARHTGNPDLGVAEPTIVRRARPAAAPRDGDGGAVLWPALAAGGVLLLGLAAGRALRRPGVT